MDSRAKNVQVRSDLTLDFVEQGNPDGVPLLLLHGLGDSWRSYEPVLEHLPRSVRAFAISQRGHGDSSRPEDGYAFRHFVTDIDLFLDALEIESAVLAGHSSHGVVIEKFALEYASRALGLVLIGTPVTLSSNERARDLYESTISKLSDSLDPDFVRRFAGDTLAQPVSPSFLEIITEEAMKVPARVFKEFFKDLIETDLSTELHKIDAPALLVWGDQDAILSREDQERLSKALRNSRLVVYPGAGHSPHWEEPDRFASDVEDFIKEL
jgi:non-heme chloroperoxidase